MRGTAWQLLQSLLPAWRFFEDVESTADLYYRSAAGSAGDYGPWQSALRPPPRGALALLFNPRGNLALAEQSLVEQLLAELDGCPLAEAPSLVPYRLVQQLVKQRLRSQGVTAPGRYQFRLDADAEEAFVSEGHSL